MKRHLRPLWMIESHVRGAMAMSRWLQRHIPIVGPAAALLVDRMLLIAYGLDVTSKSVNIGCLSISHPGGILLGGNGIVSPGRVAVMAGVKFVGRSPNDPRYVAAAREGVTFRLGDNVVIGANSVVVGPVEICDDVVIGAMSLVNSSITEPGVYVGCPARRIADAVTDEWVAHLLAPKRAQRDR